MASFGPFPRGRGVKRDKLLDGTLYLLRVQEPHMGVALGYGRVGIPSGLFHTVPVPASVVTEIKPQEAGYSSTYVTHLVFVSDHNHTRPTVALYEEHGASWLRAAPVTLTAIYPKGSDLGFRGSESHSFPPGSMTHASVSFLWSGLAGQPGGDRWNLFLPQPNSEVRLEMYIEGYKPSVVEYSMLKDRQYVSRGLLAAEDGPSATELLPMFGYPPMPDPSPWILNRAHEDLLTGRANYLYPPLESKADVNGDGVIDAGDIIAARQAKPSRGTSDVED